MRTQADRDDDLKIGRDLERRDVYIDRLREALCTAMRQWKFYSEMVERVDDFDLAIEKSPEGDLYRSCKATYEQTVK